MRHHWLFLSYLGILLWTAPANAGTLVSWRFDASQNQLTFSTDKQVQPKAKLIQNPTRLVIDLPGTTIKTPLINKNLSGAIKTIRIGQPTPQMARLVIELAPGYTLDPQKLQIRGTSATSWMVNLPTPVKDTTTVAEALPPLEPIPKSPLLSSDRDLLPRTPQKPALTPSLTRENPNPASKYIQVTKNGLFINIDSKDGDKINVVKNEEQGTIEVNLIGVNIPDNLKSQNFDVNSYGVESIRFSQVTQEPSVARLTLKVSPNSGEWDGAISKLGGVVLWPKGGVSSLANNSNTTPAPRNLQPRDNNKKTTITSVEFSDNNEQLIINSDRPLKGIGTWNNDIRVYQIKIPNAQLADDFNNPELSIGNPVSRLRIRQDESGDVLILIKPSLGVSFDQLKQNDDNQLSLSLKPQTGFNPTLSNVSPPLPNEASQLGNVPNSSASSSNSTLDRAWQRISPRAGNSVRNRKLVVVIDPGHGGQDPGAIGIGGLQETEVILPISKTVQELLEKQGITVILTRDSDYFVTLDGRTRMANRSDADLFVSIHANSMGMGRPDINGLETYYFSSGRELAQTIHRNILKRIDIPDRRVRRARFYVLRKTLMPSVLVEVGFVTGSQDSERLKNPNYRQKMAEAIAAGILEYIQNNKL